MNAVILSHSLRQRAMTIVNKALLKAATKTISIHIAHTGRVNTGAYGKSATPKTDMEVRMSHRLRKFLLSIVRLILAAIFQIPIRCNLSAKVNKKLWMKK